MPSKGLGSRLVLRVTAAGLLGLLTCCHGEPRPPAPGQAAASTGGGCRVGPDGAPVLADRGIGGTGSPIVVADRGIGGTGIDNAGENTSNAHWGGTGIVGVITGFASLCLAGQEVALPAGVPIALDGRPAGPDVLRAGQVAVVEAADAPVGLSARRIVIRYEVVGPVERVDGDRLRVAGQSVQLSRQSWGVRPARGDWVAVSGFRRSDGVIVATRVERRAPGQVVVHGTLTEQAGGLRVGDLAVRRDASAVALVGQPVTVAGVIGADGELLPLSVTPDVLEADPAAFFGPQVGVVLIESFAVLEGGRLRLAPGFSAPAGSFPSLRLDGRERGVFRFERVDGGLRAVGLAGSPGGIGPTSAFRFEPAPVPNRAISGPAVGAVQRGGRGGRRDRFDRQGGAAPDPAGPGGSSPLAPAGSDAAGNGPPRPGPGRGR